MGERELEERMHAFLAGDADVLVSTTIIESGIDIPQANTLVVERADTLGLSQLYQIRGRVGRSDVTAHAYLLYPDASELTPEARARLATLADHTELGAGFQIAMRDLEIRGAGDLLGAEQSGHVAALGFELYVEMLDEAVAELSGQTRVAARPVRVDARVDAFVPARYISSEALKIDLHRRLALVESDDELRELQAATEDRYGPLPEPVENLFAIQEAKLALARIGADYLVYRGGRATVGPVQLGSGELRALRAVADTAVYSTSRREVSRRTEDLAGCARDSPLLSWRRAWPPEGGRVSCRSPNGIRTVRNPGATGPRLQGTDLMKPIRMLALLLAALALRPPRVRLRRRLDDVPKGSVATVDGEDITKRPARRAARAREEDLRGEQARRTRRPGRRSTRRCRTQAVAFLVQRVEYDHEADKLGLTVSDKEVDDTDRQGEEGLFKGKRGGVRPSSWRRRATPLATFRDDVRAQILSEKLFEPTSRKDVKVTDADVEKYYAQNKQQYTTPESRARPAHPRQDQGRGDEDLRPAAGGRRLRQAGEGEVARPGLEGPRRRAHDREGPDGRALRADRVPAARQVDLPPGEDGVRLARHPAARRGQGRQRPRRSRRSSRGSSTQLVEQRKQEALANVGART